MDEIVKEVEVGGVWYQATVEYEISGRYIPATRTDPEEWPDVEWQLSHVIDEFDNEVTDRETLKAIEAELSRLNIESECMEMAAEAAEQFRADEKWDARGDW